MTTRVETQSEQRQPLTRERVLLTAVALADREGIAALTMRKLAHGLGVEAMSLYYHVTNKDALLDGVVEVVVGEINAAVEALDDGLPVGGWKQRMRARILAARQVLLRHPWAPALLEARSTMSPSVVLYFESLLGLMRAGGFSYDLAHHALHALGSRAIGFSQELFQPEDADGGETEATDLLADMADRLPHLVGMVQSISHESPETTLGWCDDQTEFEFGLDLILDGLERMHENS